MSKILFALFVAIAATGCGPLFSSAVVRSESMNGSYDNTNVQTAFTRVSISRFDGRDAFWTCVRLQNQQVYNNINQAAYAREMGVGAFYMSLPTNVVTDCQMRTSGPNGGMGGMYNGASLAPGISVIQGGSFDAMRVPAYIPTGPTVAVVPVQTGAYLPNGVASSGGTGANGAPSNDVLNHRIGIIHREVNQQGRAIERMQARR